MIAHTATRLVKTAKDAQPPWPVHVTVGITQGKVSSTSGSLKDWPWFDLGTAAWPSVPLGLKPDERRFESENQRWDQDMVATDAVAPSETAVVLAEVDVMARMEVAAAAGDERAFLAAKDAIDWESRTPANFLRAIQLALAAGAHMAARNLAAQGATRYPDNVDLEKYARVLAPPRVLRSDAPPQPGLRANRDWLMTHGSQYRGQWVALRQGQLLGVADSLVALKKLIGDTPNVLLTKAF